MSVWVGLDLMLVKGAASQVTIGSRNDEDLEAAVVDLDKSLDHCLGTADGIPTS